jgi:hypothetical protein
MPGTFVLFVAVLALWPVGLVWCAVLLGGLLLPRYRLASRAGLLWGSVGGIIPAAGFAMLGTFTMGGADFAGSKLTWVLARIFFAGFAVITLLWYFFAARAKGRKVV